MTSKETRDARTSIVGYPRSSVGALLLVLSYGEPGVMTGAVASVSVIHLVSHYLLSSGGEFATELPPNSPKRREDPTTGPGLDRRFLAFLGGEGGIRTPGTSKRHNGFRDRRIQPLCHLSAQTSWRL